MHATMNETGRPPEGDKFYGFRSDRMPVTGRVVFGLVVIGLGVLFTLDNLGLVDSGDVLRWWPLLLVGYGAMQLLGLWTRPRVIPGLLFVGVGLMLLLNTVGLLRQDLWDLWPLVLVAVGFSMVSGAMARARGLVAAAPAEGDQSISAFALMSGTDRKVVSKQFRGGDVTAIMGGHEIDLRGVELADGSATLDLLVWWGGVDLRVPQDWSVICDGLVVMGAIEDNTKPSGGPPTGRLVLQGLVVMGGVEVKN